MDSAKEADLWLTLWPPGGGRHTVLLHTKLAAPPREPWRAFHWSPNPQSQQSKSRSADGLCTLNQVQEQKQERLKDRPEMVPPLGLSWSELLCFMKRQTSRLCLCSPVQGAGVHPPLASSDPRPCILAQRGPPPQHGSPTVASPLRSAHPGSSRPEEYSQDPPSCLQQGY